MKRTFKKINIIAIILLLLGGGSWFFSSDTTQFFIPKVLAGKRLRCSICGKSIKGKFVKSNNKAFCSRRCYEKTLPRCSVCKQICRKGYKQYGGKNYCSKKCVSSIWPKCNLCRKRSPKGVMVGNSQQFYCRNCAGKARCFSCHLPGADSQLDDGRNICKKCGKTAIHELSEAEKVFIDVRRKMKEKLGLSSRHSITLALLDIHELKARSTHYTEGMELGLYVYESTITKTTTTKTNIFGGGSTSKTKTKVTDERNSIFALYGIPKKKLIEVFAHELGHDWMQEAYPNIKDLKVKEGWAEYVASQMNIVYGQKEMNQRMHKNPDKIYGDGFRMVNKIATEEGQPGLTKLFRKYNKK